MPETNPKRSLAEFRPDLVDQANGWDPSSIRYGSSSVKEWRCPKGHVWKASVFRRAVENSGCPICSKRKIQVGVNDFATTHPHLAREVISGDPTSIASGSSKKLKWRCSMGHEWEATVGSRVLRGTGCPYCAGKLILKGFNDLETLHPEIAKQANGWDPASTSANSHKKLSWICENGHTWKTSPNSRLSGRSRSSGAGNANGCPFCWGRQTKEGFNDISTTHKDLIAFLVDPSDAKRVSKGSEKLLEWKCDKGHTWKAKVYEMVKPGKHCPYCSGSRLLVGFNDLATTHPEFASQLVFPSPLSVSAGSKKMAVWKCNLGHEWKSKIGSRVSNSVKCPVCSGAKILVGFNDLATTNPELLPEVTNWDPTQVTRGSGKSVRWKCLVGHVWVAKITDRTGKQSGCPNCAEFGYDTSKFGYVYLMSHEGWGLLQIGITNVPKRRLASHKAKGWVLIEVEGPMNGFVAKELEHDILAGLKSSGIRLGPKEIAGNFDGYTESWIIQDFPVKSLKQLRRKLNIN